VDPTAPSVALTTSDGVGLNADLAPADDPIATAVLCHPHPRFGGNRFNAVVAALFRALPAAGITALRFDFRPGSGADGGDLSAERLDVAAALAELARTVPDRPRFLVGYSFGAGVALGVGDPDLAALVAVAPPLAVMSVPRPPAIPTLLLVPALDQYSPPPVVVPIVAGWPAATVEPVAGADHFLVGHTAAVADRATEWLAARAVAT
jgi:alpha/beta superfamily hydrolase